MKPLLLIVALALLFTGAPPGHAAETPTEAQLKAAYLYNFAKFIHWPEGVFKDDSAPLVIGVLGKNDLRRELMPLRLKTVRDRAIEIKQFQSLSEVSDCQIIYVGTLATDKLKEILQQLSHKPIITVGADSRFVDYGGVIQFVTRRGRLRFLINLRVAKANGIKIDAQLLSLAAEVQRGGE